MPYLSFIKLICIFIFIQIFINCFNNNIYIAILVLFFISYFGNTKYIENFLFWRYFLYTNMNMEEPNVSTYRHMLAGCLSVHLSVLFWDKCFGRVNSCLKHLIIVRIFCLFYITVFFQMRIVLDKYVVYNFFSGEKNYSWTCHIFFFNFLMKLLFSHPIKPFNFMNPSILKYLYYIVPYV